ncbi:hypothetical protein roselon_02708 [Roseibacterium elongatum DSM 19469]|uniref:UDP-2,3-diacylglucosamine pyrophosphatase n=1 Tax=Roseicyclus elongatus DSM 19469 TaxID=1294273 RepID=W8S497_9RHOB|nr:UDP-2,3-diacylglucosamine diphosphatase LpxI [Roseibacterium elongatum]AHM05007.1 hypothetical protein roselon_02708 [Roseibacterium elongatum DSM 19469]
MVKRAIIAGTGALPALLLAGSPAHVVSFDDVPPDLPGMARLIPARFEKLGKLFYDLSVAGVREVAFAGAMSRPVLDPGQFDAATAALVPRLTAAMAQGDDALLRDVMALFEERGFAILGAHQIRPDLVAEAGALCGPAPNAVDVARARAVLDALGPLDVGQAAIAAQGQVIGIETLQGTDALLQYVAATAPASGGVLVKRPKPGQDLRVDMPAIGPRTVHLAAEAGLSAIEIAAGAVLLLDRAAVLEACAETGLALWAAA